MHQHVLTSARNQHVARWLRLRGSRGIRRYRQCLVSGEKLVWERLARSPARCLELIGVQTPLSLVRRFPHLRVFCVSARLFAQLDVLGTHFPLLVCQTPHIPLMDGEEPPRALELLCPLSDPANVGALIRTSLAFGVEKVILLKEAAHPFLPKSIRASGGAVFEQPLAWGPPLRGMEGKSWLVALDPTGEDLTEFLWPRAVRVLVGEEGRGLGDLRCANRLAIPMASHVQSLNAAVATSLALFSYRLQYPLSRAS